MKLFPPEQPIKIYEQGFGYNDILDRKPSGEALSSLVERIEDPLVVVLDGAWGTGKSYFLQRWVGAHTLENGGTAHVVYFDAFAHDFLDDPLTGLAGAVNKRLPSTEAPQAKKVLKTAVAKLARPALRLGLAAATAGISEAAGAMVDAIATKGSDELEKAVDQFWQREAGKLAAMEQVHSALREITTSEISDQPRKLVIVVDELDRCRPDYALATLEVIKHFFAVPNVHFVLGVNLEALEHSVRSRYGENIDAEGYLRRFISLIRTLPEASGGRQANATYLLHQGQKMDLHKDLLATLARQITLGGTAGKASIRDVNKILSLAALMPSDNFDRWYWGYKVVGASLLLQKALNPRLLERARRKSVTLSEIKNFYGVTDEQLDENNRQSGKYNHDAFVIVEVWRFLLSSDEETTNQQISRGFDSFPAHPSQVNLDQFVRDKLETFQFPEQLK